mmetsp:Transcript_37345/g.111548  ORF Transcript_37345/g.111548 Transcript_37345/m.111548 type:complete len:241 (-) Transcript_37345:215-937(-)
MDLPGLDNGVAVVRAQEHVDVQVCREAEVVGRQEAPGPTDGVPALAVILLRVHGVVAGAEDPIRGREVGGVLREDGLAVPEDAEPLVALLGSDVRHNQQVIFDERASDGDADGRACGGKAAGVAETAMDAEFLRLHKVVLARIRHRDGRSVDAVPRDYVRVPEDGALAPRPGADKLREVGAAWLALARVDVALAEAHALPGHSAGVVGEEDSLTALSNSTYIPALLKRDVVEGRTGARAN